MQRVPSHFWAQSDPQNGAHCQAIIVFILTRSVGPTHLSITYCSGCIAYLLLAKEKSELSHIMPAGQPDRKCPRFFPCQLQISHGFTPLFFLWQNGVQIRTDSQTLFSSNQGKKEIVGYFGRMRSSKIKGRTPFKRCLLPAC